MMREVKMTKFNNIEKIQTAFFISNSGSDDNIGTLEQPFKSIEKAQQVVKSFNGNMSGDVIVYLRGGKYHITNTLKFTEKDSGTNGYNVVYKAYAGETVVVSGGKTITGWKKVANSTVANLWVAEVPDVAYTRHFFVNGKSATRTKGEQAEASAWDLLEDSQMEFNNLLETVNTCQGDFSVYEGYKTTKAEMLAWKNQSDIEFVYDVGWTHVICPVDSIVPLEDGAFVKMKMPCFRDCQIKGGVRIGSPSYIENAYELLKEPGEWYFKRDTRKLYYIPRLGEDIEQVEAIIPVIEKLIELRGTLDKPVHNIQFNGITFGHTTFLRPGMSGHAEVQANLIKDPTNDILMHSAYIKTPASIVLDAAAYLAFHNCDFYMLGSGAIDIQNGSNNNMISGNKFKSIAATGIQVGDFTVKDAHPEDERSVVKDNVIVNNYFNEIGTDLKGSVAVNVGFAEGTLIAHNEISNIAYSGISVGWAWGYWDENVDRTNGKPPEAYPKFTKPTVSSKNRIEYNHIHHVLQKLHDGAGVYTLSMQAGSTIKGNVIHDNGEIDDNYGRIKVLRHISGLEISPEVGEVLKSKGFPGGIYQDEASGGFEVSENIVYNVLIPYFYHEIGIEGRFDTINLHDNYFDVKPEDKSFPTELAERAGLEDEFRHLKG
ncbi:MAG: right-handed parallel beta-helix repeat-containing protein [Vallitaleaceae bacterium]|nr:right-handed parallel beta-helix repeat-containing protein [Vallitaleaceae bacterium]